jgi:nucleoside-diphosphate-sugar epimerase
MIESINRILGSDVKPTYAEPRLGDVKHSLANIKKAQQQLGYGARKEFGEGLEELIKEGDRRGRGSKNNQ